MGKLSIRKENNETQVTLILDGRIDTNTSLDLQEALDEEWASPKDITLDFEKISYMSSAGLRVILSAQKKATAQNTEFKLVKVSEPVMEVLDVVGFLEFITVE